MFGVPDEIRPTFTHDHQADHHYLWVLYVCSSCGKAVVAGAELEPGTNKQVGKVEVYPGPRALSNDIPLAAAKYLSQAMRSLHSPDGAVMLAASSVDAMLKAKGLVEGSLYARIKKACADHIITSEMGDWAHAVRLDANETRHADQDDLHHTFQSAQRAVDFALAIAEFMFVLPARVQRGRDAAADQNIPD